MNEPLTEDMTFEQQIDELVASGDYIEVRNRVASAVCPHATAMKGKKMVREAAEHHVMIIENRAARGLDYETFAAHAKSLVTLAEDSSFPSRVKAGKTAVKLYSERMATIPLKLLSMNPQVPESVVSAAKMELSVCRLDCEFLCKRTAAAVTRTQRPATRMF